MRSGLYSKSLYIRTYQNKHQEALFPNFVIKNIVQFDETWVLIAEVAKLIFDCCNEVHFGTNWLLKRDSLPKSVIRSMRILPEQIMGLDIFCKTYKKAYKRHPSNKNVYTFKLALMPLK